MPDLHIVILAAGKGTRLRSDRAKVLHRVAGVPMLEWVLRTASAMQPASTTVVLGHMAESVGTVLERFPSVTSVLQAPQLGTGHALLQTDAAIGRASGTVLLLSGDVPQLRVETVQSLVQHHRTRKNTLTVLTAKLSNPSSYGRIVRDATGRLLRIVEDRDATPDEREIAEINSGIFALELAPLFGALRQIGSQNAQGEYYLPDLVGIYREQGLATDALLTDRADEVLGINTRSELATVSGLLWRARAEALMATGVTIEDPLTAYIGPDVDVEPDTVIFPGVSLEGRTRIGRGCEIHSGVRIVDSTLEADVTVLDHCVITKSTVAAGVVLGPFAHLRPHSDVREGARIGNFVEVKNTRVGAGVKAGHLSYLGDATIGERVNIGAGTITCNYDGTAKHQTTIEDEVFIGSDSQLIAPVRIGRGAYVAAGSSITEDVPPGALGIARGRQVNKADWVEKARKARTK